VLTRIPGLLAPPKRRFGPAWSNDRISASADYTIVNSDKGKTLDLVGGGGTYFTASVNAATTYDASFAIWVVNNDAVRAKAVSCLSGSFNFSNGLSPSGAVTATSFFLYPKQSALLFILNGAWWASVPIRWKTASSIQLFVDTALGNDSNDGLATGSGAALATLQKAYDTLVSALDTGGNNLTIRIADGTYAAGLNATKPWTGGGNLSVTGNTTTPANCHITPAAGNVITLGFNFPGTVSFAGLKLTSQGASTIDLYLPGSRGTCGIGNMLFNGSQLANILVSGAGARVQSNNGLNVFSGSPGYAVYTDSGGFFVSQGQIHTVTGFPTYGGAFVLSDTNANQSWNGVAFKDASAHTRQTTTGDIHTNTTLDNIAINTSNLTVGMFIVGTNIPSGTKIQSIDTASKVTMTAAATATTAGLAVKFEIAAGAKFNASNNSVLSTAGGGADFFPGTTAGSGTNSGTSPYGLYT
jgi:hypothetical protein